MFQIKLRKIRNTGSIAEFSQGKVGTKDPSKSQKECFLRCPLIISVGRGLSCGSLFSILKPQKYSTTNLESQYVFWGKISIQIFCPFSDWVVFLISSCISCLHIMDNPLLVTLFANIFSPHSTVHLFIMSFVSFAMQKLFNLIRPHFLFLLFFLLP